MKLLDFESANGETKYAVSPAAITYIDDADGEQDRVMICVASGKCFAVVGQFDKVVERVNAAIELVTISS